MGRTGKGHAGARRAVVVLGRLRLADERRRSGGGRSSGSSSSPRWRGCWWPRCACPDVFDDTGLLFACAYGVVRAAHIVLFVLASRDDPGLRKSITGLAVSTAIGLGPAGGRLVRRRDGAGRPVGARAGARHGRPAALRPGGLEADARALRRAPRADRDHRAGRVDRRDRRRRRAGRRRGHRRRRGARDRRGRRALVALLRRRRARRRAAAEQRGAGQGAERASRATPSRSCTSRWSPASCWSRWA